MAKRLIILQGLPGAGKTTWALAEMLQCADHDIKCVRVNQDDIRKELGWTSWKTWDFKSKEEKEVHKIKMRRILEALKDSSVQVIISDDTNLSRKVREALFGMGKQFFAEVEVHRFDVKVEECVRRDSLRPEAVQVGAKVIEEMAIKHGMLALLNADGTTFPLYKPDKVQKSAIICDLDGTLSRLNGRDPYDASTCDKDECDQEIRIILETFYRFLGFEIIYVSGREDAYKDKTNTFLAVNHCPPGPLYMRKSGDHRKGAIVKNEIFEQKIKDNYYVRFVLDDRDQVVQMWRKKGLKCLQAAYGDL